MNPRVGRVSLKPLILLLGLALLLVPVAPASAAGPSWRLGGVDCNLIAPAEALPFGVGPCPGVRPGAIVRSEKGSCTFNFLFVGSDGNRYMGTAGHCILGDSVFSENAGEEVWLPGAGPAASDGAGRRVGEFAYAVLQSPKDFALVRLDPGVAADPQMCHFGGPTAINNERPSTPVVLHHRGNGIGFGSTVSARTHVAPSMPDADHVFAMGAAISGDSGSGVISSDGRAVGVLVTVGVHAGGLTDAGFIGITRLQPQIDQAARALGVSLALQTASTL